MDLLYALSLLFDSVVECFSSPLGLLLLAGAATVQILFLWSTEDTREKTRWTLLILSGVMVLACPALFFLIKEFSVAFLAGVMFPYTVVIFSGVLAGTLIYKIRTKVRYS